MGHYRKIFIPTPSIILLLMQAYCKYLCHNGELCNSLIKLYAASCGTPCKFFFSHFVFICVGKQASPLLQLGAAAHVTS